MLWCNTTTIIFILILNSLEIRKMERHQTCYKHAQRNEKVFRNILRDIKKMVGVGRKTNLLENFDTEAGLEDLLKRCPYSADGRKAILEVLDFKRGPFCPDDKDFEYGEHRELKNNEAIIKFRATFTGSTQDSSFLYKINLDNSVEYIGFVGSGFHLSNKITLN